MQPLNVMFTKITCGFTDVLKKSRTLLLESFEHCKQEITYTSSNLFCT